MVIDKKERDILRRKVTLSILHYLDEESGEHMENCKSRDRIRDNIYRLLEPLMQEGE